MGDFRKMNQNGMQGAAGVPQQMGQQVQQQQPGQMPGDQPDNPQIMNFLNEANENNWKEESYRNRVCQPITDSHFPWQRKFSSAE